MGCCWSHCCAGYCYSSKTRNDYADKSLSIIENDDALKLEILDRGDIETMQKCVDVLVNAFAEPKDPMFEFIVKEPNIDDNELNELN